VEWVRHVVRPRFAGGIGSCAEELERLRLRCRGEGDESHASIVRPRSHLRGEEVFSADLASVIQFLQFFGTEDGFQLCRRFPALGAVRLVGGHGETFPFGGGEFPHRLEGEGESLDRADDDLLRSREGLGQFRALAARASLDRGDDSGLALEVEKRVMKLRVDHIAVRDDEDAVEEFAVFGVVQLGEEMGRPRNRVSLARSGAVLDEVFGARTVREHGGLEPAGHVELVVAGEDDLVDLVLLISLPDEVSAEDLEPALALPDLLPEIGGAVTAGGIYRIPRAAVVAPVEGKKARPFPFEPGRHVDLGIAHREVDEGTAGEGEERLRRLPLRLRIAVVAILVDCVAHALGEVGLQFRRRHGDAVEEEDEVDAVLVVERVTHLPHRP